MGKNQTSITVKSVFAGSLDATDVFVSLIVKKYHERHAAGCLAGGPGFRYTESKVPSDRVPSGSRGERL